MSKEGSGTSALIKAEARRLRVAVPMNLGPQSRFKGKQVHWGLGMVTMPISRVPSMAPSIWVPCCITLIYTMHNKAHTSDLCKQG